MSSYVKGLTTLTGTKSAVHINLLCLTGHLGFAFVFFPGYIFLYFNPLTPFSEAYLIFISKENESKMDRFYL